MHELVGFNIFIIILTNNNTQKCTKLIHAFRIDFLVVINGNILVIFFGNIFFKNIPICSGKLELTSENIYS